MGEETAATLKDEIQIKATTAAETLLNASVSFGRFENDLLCWERWSSFSQNKYLEEVEKCSTPGSVAEKRAYFEAHYKKIAAKKAEILAQEQEMGPDLARSDHSSHDNALYNGCVTNLEFEVPDFDNRAKSEEADKNSTVVGHSNHIDEPKQDSVGPDSNEGMREVESLDSSKPSNSEVVVSVKEDNDLTGLQAQLEELAASVKEAIVAKQDGKLTVSLEQLEKTNLLDNQTVNSQVNKKKDATLKPQKERQKTTSAVKEKNLARTRKETAARTSKSAHTPLPNATKPVTPPATVPSRISTTKQSRSLLPRNRNPSSVESKRSTPKSPHMSISLAPTNADSRTMIRRSLIMEEMGDKEIVQRAFGQFQKNLNLSRPSTVAKPTVPHKVSTNGTKHIGTPSITPRKDKEGPVKAAWEHQRSAKGSPLSTFGLRSDERAEKRKEFTKKLEKSNAKEIVNTHLRSKSKEQKEVDIKKLRQSLNVKATPMPDFHRGQQILKTNMDKEAAKNESHK